MNPSSIATALVAAAALLKKPIAEVSAQAIQDSYHGVKNYLLRKFGAESPAAKALEMATDKPGSEARRLILTEEFASSDLKNDPQFASLFGQLQSDLKACNPVVPQIVRVVGDANHVQIAGRDLITTHKHVQRNIITPNERHLTVEQSSILRRVIGEVALRLGSAKNGPNYAAVHRLLQQRFAVHSYILIPRDQFDDAVSFLKERRAIYRSRMRRSDPAAYQNDLFRSIFFAADKLEWSPSQVCEYATKMLRIEEPIASLKELGPIQLKTVERLIKRELTRKSEPN